MRAPSSCRTLLRQKRSQRPPDPTKSTFRELLIALMSLACLRSIVGVSPFESIAMSHLAGCDCSRCSCKNFIGGAHSHLKVIRRSEGSDLRSRGFPHPSTSPKAPHMCEWNAEMNLVDENRRQLLIFASSMYSSPHSSSFTALVSLSRNATPRAGLDFLAQAVAFSPKK